MKPGSHRERLQSEIQHGKKIVSRAEEVWNWTGRIGRARYARRLKFLATRLIPGARCLEIGCGTGLFSEGFAGTGAKLVSIDVSHDLILQAKSRLPRGHFIEADACLTCFKNESFDVVIGSSILHHLDIPSTLREIYRILKKGGSLWFTEPNYLNPHVFLERKIKFLRKVFGVSDFETAIVRWKLQKLLRQIGFTSIAIKPFDFLYPFLPDSCLGLLKVLGRILENTPLVDEIASSVQITATK